MPVNIGLSEYSLHYSGLGALRSAPGPASGCGLPPGDGLPP